MKNKEIEELLNYLKDENEYYTEEEEVSVNCGELILEKEDVDLLLSYIEQLKKEIEEYQKELEKADSITQSCIFNGKKDSEISYRKCLNLLEKYKENIKQLENNRDKAIPLLEENVDWGEDMNSQKAIDILKGDSDVK